MLLQNSEFRLVGTLIAMSSVQGGPGFPVLLPALYNYVAMGHYSLDDVSDSDVPDLHVQDLLSQVHKGVFIHVRERTFLCLVSTQHIQKTECKLDTMIQVI